MANPAAAMKIAHYLSDFLNTKIGFSEVFDEMFLIEHGMCGKDKMLNKYIRETMAEWMTPKTQADYKKLKNPISD